MVRILSLKGRNTKEAFVINDLFGGKIPSLFLFDMDHTLINNDCDVSWKQFLVDKGEAPAGALNEAQRYYEDYVRGELDITPFLQFQLEEFRGRSPEDMRELAVTHFEEVVKERVYSFFRELLTEIAHRKIPRAIVTATNEIIAGPVAEYLQIPTVLATKLELEGNRFTGELFGEYCYSEGKVTAAGAFAEELQISFEDTAYFGDSLSDVPLLKRVAYPVLINPSLLVKEHLNRDDVIIIHP